MRNEANKTFLLISLGSPVFSSNYVSECISISNNDKSEITLVILDKYEAANRTVLYQESKQSSFKVVEQQVEGMISRYSNIAEVIKSNDLAEIKEYSEIEREIRQIYDENVSTQHYVNNEVFRNLDPRLRSIGVRNSRDSRVALLTPYLLHEAAVYAWLANTGRYTKEISPKKRPRSVLEKLFSQKQLQRLDNIDHYVVPADPTHNLLNVENVSLLVAKEKFILNSISLTVPEGGIVGVVGPNGSGKSTLLNVLAGHISISEGQIMVDGKDVTRSAPRHRQVSTVFQNPKLLPGHSVEGNLRLFSKSSKIKSEQREKVLSNVVELLKLQDLLEKPTESLSGGESQRVAIARSLVSGAALLLLDEPGSALDIYSRITLLRNVAELIRCRREEYYPRGAIVVAHDPDLIAAICDQVIVLDLGQIITKGEVYELVRNPQYLSAANYLCPANTLALEIDENEIKIGGGMASIRESQLMEILGSEYKQDISWGNDSVYLHVPTTALYFGAVQNMLETRPLEFYTQKPRVNSFELFFEDSESIGGSLIVACLSSGQQFPVTSTLSIDLKQCALVSDHKL